MTLIFSYTDDTKNIDNIVRRQSRKHFEAVSYYVPILQHLCFNHYIFIISQLWLTSHPRSTVVLLGTGTPGTSREIYSEDVDGETRTRNPRL